MKLYTLNFKGRQVGAIGIFSEFTEQIMADNIEQAWLRLYDTHAHITRGCWSAKPTTKSLEKTKSLMRGL